jgi:hypothetical protein
MDYKFAVLRHQASLGVAETENFAVLVEGKLGTSAMLFAVGRVPEPPVEVSELGSRLLKQFPAILGSLVETAINQKKASEDVLDWMYGSMSWNFQLSKPQVCTSEEKIHSIAFKLFSEYVAGSEELVKGMQDAARLSLRSRERTESLGNVYHAVVPIPTALAVA